MAVSLSAALVQVKREIGSILEPAMIHRSCKEHGHDWQEGTVLDPAATLHLMLRQVAEGNVTGKQAVRIAGGTFTEAAWCQARQRLPLAVMQDIARQTATAVRDASEDLSLSLADDDAPHEQLTWHGRRVRLIDGTNFSMSDAPALREHFGDVPGQKPGCGFPIAHCLTLFGMTGGELAYHDASPKKTGDIAHTPQAMRDGIRPGDVLLGDDVWGCFVAQAMLCREHDADGIFPIFHARKVDFTPNRSGGPDAPQGSPSSRWIASLGIDDQLVEWFRPVAKPKWMTREQFDALPPSIVVREIRRTVHRPGFRPQVMQVVTTLLDADGYPADEVVALRGQRWNVETDIRHLKTTMKMEVLRSQTVEGIHKELAAFAVVYNLVRLVMVEAARRQQVSPRRLSFADALAWLRHADPGHALPRINAVPHRPGRSEPRVIKRRPKPFDLMNKPRAVLRKCIKDKYSGTA
jgi:hypothetical protein